MMKFLNELERRIKQDIYEYKGWVKQKDDRMKSYLEAQLSIYDCTLSLLNCHVDYLEEREIHEKIDNLLKLLDDLLEKGEKMMNEHKEIWIVLAEIFTEVRTATTKFPSFNSAHEGYAVLLEEVDELWENVKLNQHKNPDRDRKIREEAIQVGAMAMRIVLDCCKNVTPHEPVSKYLTKKEQEGNSIE